MIRPFGILGTDGSCIGARGCDKPPKCHRLMPGMRDVHVEAVADLHEFPFVDEAWFGVAPDGSALGLQGIRVQEIYSVDWIRP